MRVDLFQTSGGWTWELHYDDPAAPRMTTVPTKDAASAAEALRGAADFLERAAQKEQPCSTD